ncbi:glycoside hydrolase family 104 protein [Rhodoferax sp. GW822-FHT02A01]|uniref:glycoside hydrolase family 24 protein n=1 Tax=Rhodoferax sp. GW822-FHT02A01 TaxID=3141537 RepID=UPI00315CB377
MIAHSEIGAGLLAVSDNGYNVLVGATAEAPLLFDSYADHPNILNKDCNSTAAGRYQLLHRWWPPYRDLLKLPDFGPDSQDAVALQQIRECHALDEINAGQFEQAVHLCAHIWASLPGAGYGQHENKLAALQQAYTDAGGTLA